MKKRKKKKGAAKTLINKLFINNLTICRKNHNN